MTRPADLNRFYELLKRAAAMPGGSFLLRELSTIAALPQRGVYFVFEPEEHRSSGEPRVVRVGTHAVSRGSRTTLRARLRTHLGSRHGGGNHRGSILRLRLGEALLARGDADRATYPVWGHGRAAPREVRLSEAPLERMVSHLIGGMHVIALHVDGESSAHGDRAYIERNAIALLSERGKAPVDPSSEQWLGRLEASA